MSRMRVVAGTLLIPTHHGGELDDKRAFPGWLQMVKLTPEGSDDGPRDEQTQPGRRSSRLERLEKPFRGRYAGPVIGNADHNGTIQEVCHHVDPPMRRIVQCRAAVLRQIQEHLK